MLLSVSGIGWAGAGAYYDLVSSYKEVESKGNSFELGIIYDTDGLVDLINKLKFNNSRTSSSTPIERFLELAKFYNDWPWYSSHTNNFLYKESQAFVDKITTGRQVGIVSHDLVYENLGRKIKRILNDRVLCYFRRFHINLSINYNVEHFVCKGYEGLETESRIYFSKLIKNLRQTEGSKLLIKHLCPPDMPEVCLPFIEETVKHITVNRDPRDVYIQCLRSGDLHFPCENVEDFIRFYRATCCRRDNTNNYLFLNFEDLCFEFEKTRRIVENFMELKPEFSSECKFKPEVSRNNTQLYKKFEEYKKDIEIIEKELSEYLYPFEKYSK